MRLQGQKVSVVDSKLYLNRQKIGIWQRYDPRGNLSTELDYSTPQTNIKKYYQNGNLKAEGEIKLDLKLGIWQYYDEKGNRVNTQDHSK